MILEKLENKILRLYDQNKTRTASNLILKEIRENKTIFKNKEVLKKVINPYGYTVAHALAFLSVEFSDIEILKLTGENRSDLNVLGHSGSSVAFALSKRGIMFESKEIQMLSGVAINMAKNGYIFKDIEILKLPQVAHEMARLGYKFDNEEILSLENETGVSVLDFQNAYEENNKRDEFQDKINYLNNVKRGY